MATLLRDLRYALRTMRKAPGFTVVAILTIALAIGANTAIFSFINGLLLNPLPYPDADRIMLVLERRPDGGRNGISTLNYLDWAEQNTVFEYFAGQAGWSATLTGGDEPVRIIGGRVSPQYFDINGTVAAYGRTFVPGEDQPGSDNVVLLSYALWESRYGADPGIIGSEILLDGQAHTIIGVLGEGSSYDRSAAQIWKPLAFTPENMTRDFHWFRALGKLKAGVSLEQARAEMELIGQRIAAEYPESNKDWSVAVDPLKDMLVDTNLRQAAIILFSATFFVLLIGCANLASLALARGVARERETAVRASMGAGRWRLARQFLTENVVIAFCGGVVGIVIGFAAMRGIQAMIPPFSFPAEVEVKMDTTVMLFALVVAVVTGILFGLAPAIQATKTNLVAATKEGGHGSTPGTPGRRIRSALVVGEVALAFVLLVGSGLLIRSLTSLLDVDPGFDSTNVLTAGLPIAQTRYPDPVELNTYLDSLRAAIEGVPGVTDTAITSALPLQGWGYGMPYQIADREVVDRANRGGGFFKMVSASYFRALEISLVAGRVLSETDTAGAPPVVVINQTFAEREFPDESPIGKRILVEQIIPGQTALGEDIAWEVVGVIADEHVSSLRDNTAGGMYVTNEQSPVYGVSLIVRAGLEPLGLERAIRAAIADVNGSQALSNVRTLEQIETQSIVGERIQSRLLTIFAGIAMLLAAVGIYGVISYAVAQRTHEMGIRATLGASAADLQRLVFIGGMRPVLVGLAVGLVGALALSRVMSFVLFGVGARDPVTFAVVAVLLAAVAAVASFIPARRVAAVDPNVALRSE